MVLWACKPCPMAGSNKQPAPLSDLIEYASSCGRSAYCYAKLAVSSPAVAETAEWFCATLGLGSHIVSPKAGLQLHAAGRERVRCALKCRVCSVAWWFVCVCVCVWWALSFSEAWRLRLLNRAWRTPHSIVSRLLIALVMALHLMLSTRVSLSRSWLYVNRSEVLFDTTRIKIKHKNKIQHSIAISNWMAKEGKYPC